MKPIAMLAATILLALTTMGCGTDDTRGPEVGGLTMTLATTSARGVDYRLRGAVFEIRGPDNLDVFSEDYPEDQERIELSLASGDYAVTLAAMWSIEYSVDGSPFQAIAATLASSNPVEATVLAGQTTLVTFHFEVEEGLIDFGPGTLSVGIDVEEVAACEQTCGAGNTIDPTWTSDQETLNCTANGVPISIDVKLLGQVASNGGVPIIGVNTYDLQVEVILDTDAVNLLSPLVDEATITATNGVVRPAAGTTDTNQAFLNLPVLCSICIEQDTPVSIPLPVVQDTWNLDNGPTQALALSNVGIGLEVAGLEVTLSTVCNVQADPNCVPTCAWDAFEPLISFTTL